MTSIPKLGSGVHLNAQSRELILKVYIFTIDDAERSGHKMLIKDAIKRTSDATGVSPTSIKRILKEKRSQMSGESSQKTFFEERRRRSKPSNTIVHDKSAIRKCLHNYSTAKNESLTLMNILGNLQKDISFNGRKSTLWKVVKQLGFKSKKMFDNRRMFIERHDIRFNRIEYLDKISMYRTDRPIVYLDETRILSNTIHVTTDPLQNKKKKPSKKSHFVIAYAASSSGFVPNALFICEDSQKQSDGQDEKHYEDYEKWIETQLIPNLPPNALVVVGHSLLNNKLLDAVPSSSSKKKDMINWLTRRQIPFSDSFLKPQLYELIRSFKPRKKLYKVDDILNACSFATLRLPPSHPELNPIENIWSIIKEYIADKKFKMTLETLSWAVQEKTLIVNEDQQIWLDAFRQVDDNEKFFVEIDSILDKLSDNVINLESSDDENSETSDEDSATSDFD
ncbi:uncharacterized protein LOC143910829 [Arctopsyche grandis]|uniref:uncharacterized protein LOC143910829 n=1 Tax=Arctopsyche grandis TaxID=121162 RepID=UPI00406D66F5